MKYITAEGPSCSLRSGVNYEAGHVYPEAHEPVRFGVPWVDYMPNNSQGPSEIEQLRAQLETARKALEETRDELEGVISRTSNKRLIHTRSVIIDALAQIDAGQKGGK